MASKLKHHLYGLSFYEFSDMLEQLDFQIRFLAGLIYRVTQESGIKADNSIRVLRAPDEIANYLYKQDADCVMLTSPDQVPVVLKRKGFGWVQDMDEFANWLTVHWESDIMVIAVS
jgi:hypothetical protein